MLSDKVRKIIIIAFALLGVVINAAYGFGLLKTFLDPQSTNVVRGILTSAISLELGWVALLVWVIFKPFERRHLLLFTALVFEIGNVIQTINQYLYANAGIGSASLNLVLGSIIAGVFVVAFFVGKPAGDK